MVTLTQLKYVVALNEHKHFGRAAESCGVSQPSLSTQIQKLEEDLGFIIFDRSKKPLMITDEGFEFIKRAKKILMDIKELEFHAKNNNEVGGEFKLGVIPTLAPYLLPLFIESFAKKYPKVDLKIFEKPTKQIIKDLHNDDLDAGLLVTPLKEDGIIEKTLFLEKFYIYASKGHWVNRLKKASLKDLNKCDDIWVLSEEHCFRSQILNLCKLKNNFSNLNLSFESGSIETIKNLIKAGTGMTIVPDLATKDIKKEIIPFEDPVPSRQVSLAYSRSFLKEKVINKLEEEILNSLPKEVINLKKLTKIIPI